SVARARAVLELEVSDADQAELALAVLQRQLDVVHEQRAAAVENARTLAEHALGRGDELGRGVAELPHRRRSGTVSKPIACSSAWPMRKSEFSPNCGPTSCRPTG